LFTKLAANVVVPFSKFTLKVTDLSLVEIFFSCFVFAISMMAFSKFKFTPSGISNSNPESS